MFYKNINNNNFEYHHKYYLCTVCALYIAILDLKKKEFKRKTAVIYRSI